jgi:hypothetical protein
MGGERMTTTVERNPVKGWDVVEWDTGRVLATFRTGYEAEDYSLDLNNAELDRIEKFCEWAMAEAEKAGRSVGDVSKGIFKLVNRGMDADIAAAIHDMASSTLDYEVHQQRHTCGYDYGCRQFHPPRKKTGGGTAA